MTLQLPNSYRERAMTFVELLAVTAVVFFLAVLVLPHLIGHQGAKHRAKRISCVSNLRALGLATRLYANDHDEKLPWQVGQEDGGSLAFLSSPNVFEHFRVMSNELSTPKILVCPSDRQRIRTNEFAQMSNTNLSYFLCLNAVSNAPSRLLSGDRNVSGGVISNRFMRVIAPSQSVSWTNGLHEMAGNTGLVDGSVQQVSSSGFSNVVANSFGTNQFLRLAIP
jgi:type II secretory pathway pseudopilin PulG